jgi:hypothetical protein
LDDSVTTSPKQGNLECPPHDGQISICACFMILFLIGVTVKYYLTKFQLMTVTSSGGHKS